MQHDTAKDNTNIIKPSDKKSLNINLTSLESDSMSNEIFGMTTSMEKNYRIGSDKIDRIFDGNVIQCTEVRIIPLMIMNN